MKKRKKMWFYCLHMCLTPQFGSFHPDYEAKEYRSHAHPDRASAIKAAEKRLGDNAKYATIYWEWR